MNNNILFYGGTFNPIHIGHLLLAQYSIDQLKDIDKVVFIPSGVAAQKDDLVSAKHRLQMCKLAVFGNKQFEVEDYEVNNLDLSFTINTIRYLKTKYNIEKPKWLIGFDNLINIVTWHKIDELVNECSFVVGVYPNSFEGFKNDNWDGWQLTSPFNLWSIFNKIDATMIVFPKIDIRSTFIRMRIEQGLPITNMVTKEVEDYIKATNLYK